jgi:hypothetical protein
MCNLESNCVHFLNRTAVGQHRAQRTLDHEIKQSADVAKANNIKIE